MSRKKTTDEFVKQAKEIHGIKYDYSLTCYNGNKIPVIIRCKKCGTTFLQRPNDHLNGHGCKKCSDILHSKILSWTKEEFIEEANKKYDNFYDYSFVEYKNSTTKVKIICPKHGEFWQTPVSHLHSGGCKLCGDQKKILTEEKILKILSKFNYNFKVIDSCGNRSSKFLIEGVCKDCGFTITKSFINWKNNINICPICSPVESSGERNTASWLLQHNISFEKSAKFEGLKDIKPLSYDFYLKEYNLLIECQGEQHTKPKTFGGISKEIAQKNFEIQQKHDKMKKDFAIKNEIDLLEISYKDFKHVDKILNKKILTKN